MLTVVPEPAAGDDRTGSLQLGESCALIDDIVREGARRMLAEALQAEADACTARFADERDEHGHRLVVRNGYHQPREVVTSAGAVEVVAPRINDKRVDPETGERQKFTSVILPPWCRKTPKINEVLPLLYLHGLSSSDFGPALGQFLGSSAGLSSSVITKLTETWTAEQRAFAQRDLSDVDYVYLWADGIHVNVRLEEHKLCLLVLIGVRADGRKELVALTDGYRESTESWADLLRNCARRRMRAPVLAVGDGALGFWGALREVFPATAEQRCWFHKIANVLGALPKSAHPGAKKPWARFGTPRTKTTPAPPRRPSRRPTGRSSPKPSRRSPTISTSCSRSTTTPPSTGSTCVPRIPSSRPSRPCGCGPRSPKAPAPGRRGWPWHSSSSSQPRPAGAQSTPRTWSPWSGPAPASRPANSSNDPTPSQPTRPPRRRLTQPPNLKDLHPQVLTIAPVGTVYGDAVLAHGVAELTMYTTVWCGFCRRLKAQLDRAGIGYREVDIEHDPQAAAVVESANNGNQTVPTVQLPDGSTLTNPTIDQITAIVAAQHP